MTISYLIWNGNPEIISFGTFALRWYGLLFALGFLISQQILYYMYRQEGKPEKDVDTLTVYMVVATVLGARFGHILFYEPQMIWTDPLAIILPFEYKPEFRFTGLQGLASHGAAFGILFGLWLYSSWSISLSKSGQDGEKPTRKFGLFVKRRIRPGQSYLQVLDRIVILVTLTGALIRFGNFFNAEIIGKPTNMPLGVVFMNRVSEAILSDKATNPVASLEVRKDESLPEGENGRVPIKLYLFFKPGTTGDQARGFVLGNVKYYLTQMDEYVDEPRVAPLRYELSQEKDGTFEARIKTFGVARHPAQLYESVSCVILFLILFWMWTRKKAATPPGRIFGWFLIILWTLRFAYEFLKKNQVGFEDDMIINMGQVLSIPLIIAGIFVLIYSYRQPSEEEKTITNDINFKS